MSQAKVSVSPADPMAPTVAAGAVLVMFLWALCFPLIKYGLSTSPPMLFATLRAVLSGAVLLLIAQWLGRPSIHGTPIWGGVVLVGLTATSVGFFGMFYGGERVSPGLATVIANTQPLIAAVLARAFLHERLSPIQRFGIIAGFGGIVMISVPSLSGSDSQTLGIIFILLAAVAIAISNVALKRLAGRVDSLRAMGWQLIIGGVPLGVLALATEDVTSINVTPLFLVNLAALSVIGTAAAFALWFILLQRETLSRLNVFSFLTPVFGLLMGAVFFAEQVQAIEMLGIVLSLLGIYWVSRPSTVLATARPTPDTERNRGG
jgi:drug/metabolite transporter (DMT)-like permease